VRKASTRSQPAPQYTPRHARKPIRNILGLHHALSHQSLCKHSHSVCVLPVRLSTNVIAGNIERTCRWPCCERAMHPERCYPPPIPCVLSSVDHFPKRVSDTPRRPITENTARSLYSILHSPQDRLGDFIVTKSVPLTTNSSEQRHRTTHRLCRESLKPS
jgi:hypothetical protein